MTRKALVIDDDPAIIESVSDILDSLGHEHDRADSVEAARKCLDQGVYDYVLLDLEIPVRTGKFPRVQDGENLLEEIVQRRGSFSAPVIIVMTAHGTDGPDLAVDVMKKGAVDYVTKPFKTVGRTIDKSIREALTRISNDTETVSGAVGGDVGWGGARSFAGGEMVFFDDRVELCGVVICDASCPMKRKALDVLRQKDASNNFVPVGSKKLALAIGRRNGEKGIPALVLDLRNSISERFLAKTSQVVKKREVIDRTRAGYQLKEWITVVDAARRIADQERRKFSESPQGHGTVNGPVERPAGGTVDDAVNGTLGKVTARRQRLLKELEKGRKLRAPALAEILDCGERTVKRDINALEDEVEFVGSPSSGYYRLKPKPK
jgi:CheY-like chemotaxis protein